MKIVIFTYSLDFYNMKILFYLICLSAILTSILSCEDKLKAPFASDKNQLPPITSSGENTFGCELNGEVWLPGVPVNFGGVHTLTASMNSEGISILATRKTTDSQTYQLIGLGVHSNLSDSMSLNYPYDSTIFEMEGASAVYGDVITGCEFRTDSINNGFVKFIRIDTIERIISGIFEFNVANSSCDTVRITNGRFDIKL